MRALHRDCHQPLQRALECPAHGEVGVEEQVSGWEVAPGEFVIVEPDEIAAAVAEADDVDEHVLETIEVVPVAELDPAAVRKSYWLMPGEGAFALRGYATVMRALELESAALLVRFVAFDADHRAIVRPAPNPDGLAEALLVEELAVQGDVYSPQPIRDRVAEAQLEIAEVELCADLVRRTRRPLDARLLCSPRRDARRALLEKKLAEQATVRPVSGAPARSLDLAGGAPADLVGQLKASLKRAPRKRKPKPRAAAKRAAAR